jgi:hypothetical protein
MSISTSFPATQAAVNLPAWTGSTPAGLPALADRQHGNHDGILVLIRELLKNGCSD